MLTGTENTLKALIDTDIKAAVLSNTGNPVATPNAIDSLAEGIANAIIPHYVSNTQVLPGTFSTVSGPVSGIGLLL